MEATERLLAIGRALGRKTRDELARLAASVRTWDRFLRMRLVVLGGWAALSLLAIGIARSGGEAEADNTLNAYVALRTSPLGWALLVHNRSDEPWREVAIELEGGQVYARDVIGPDEKLVLSPWQFADDGAEAPDAPPRGVSLRVGRERIRPTLSRERGGE